MYHTVLLAQTCTIILTIHPSSLKLGLRLDGRQGKDFRPMEMETGVLNHTAGSARVKFVSTNV